MDDLLARARCFIKWIETSFQGQTVLAVGHGIINKAIQAVYYDKMTREIPKMKNGEYRKLCIQ